MLTTQSIAAQSSLNVAHGLRVLLVDDDALGRHRAARTLTRQGYEVVSAATVASALAQLGRGPFQAIVAQTCLSDGTGFDVFHAAREQGPEAAVVLVGSDPRLPATLATPSGPVRYCCQAQGPEALLAAVSELDSGRLVYDQAA